MLTGLSIQLATGHGEDGKLIELVYHQTAHDSWTEIVIWFEDGPKVFFKGASNKETMLEFLEEVGEL